MLIVGYTYTTYMLHPCFAHFRNDETKTFNYLGTLNSSVKCPVEASIAFSTVFTPFTLTKILVKMNHLITSIYLAVALLKLPARNSTVLSLVPLLSPLAGAM